MKAANAEIETLLAAWLDEGRAEALAEACALARTRALDVDALLSWAGNYGAEAVRTDLAIRRLRFAIGLPVVPGPVCRPLKP